MFSCLQHCCFGSLRYGTDEENAGKAVEKRRLGPTMPRYLSECSYLAMKTGCYQCCIQQHLSENPTSHNDAFAHWPEIIAPAFGGKPVIEVHIGAPDHSANKRETPGCGFPTLHELQVLSSHSGKADRNMRWIAPATNFIATCTYKFILDFRLAIAFNSFC